MAPTIETSHLLGLVGISLIAFTLSTIVYNLLVSPLRRVPGPKLWATSQFWYSRAIMSGTSHTQLADLHKKYGDVVRVAPNQVSFVNPKAWKDAMGHRKAGQLENGRDPAFYKHTFPGIIGPIPAEDHGRQRRILSHAFSAQSMLDQQPLIQQYVDLLLTKLKANCNGGRQALDMVQWYNWTTFDVIGDLAFGEPFGCLTDSNYHPWVSLIFQGIKQTTLVTQLRRVYLGADELILRFVPSLMNKRSEHGGLSRAKVAKRMALGTERPDFMQAMLAKNADGKDKLSQKEIEKNADLLIIAGSETTATALSGTTYLLCTHPEVMAKLTDEVRSTFSSEDEIDLLSVQSLKYMLAVLDESLRLYPPVATPGPRVVHAGGDIICDKFLPQGTIVNIPQWAMYRSPENFVLPDSFIPERWLGDARFANDRKDAFQPFLFGARNCIGRNLAYAEMRSILARVMWNFDIKLVDANEDWIGKNTLYSLWDKPPLNVYLSPRKA